MVAVPAYIVSCVIRYYHEPANGENHEEWLAVNHGTAKYYRSIGQPEMREARAAAINGSASSVCTTAVSLGFLKEKCRRVLKKDVPAKWLERF